MKIKDERYICLCKHGIGSYSTAQLCCDILKDTYCAIKVHKPATNFKNTVKRFAGKSRARSRTREGSMA